MNLQARDTLHAEIAALRAENEELREKLYQKEQRRIDDIARFPREWKLTKTDRLLVLCLIRTSLTQTKAHIFYQVWGDNCVDQKILEVYICKLRAKLRAIDERLNIITDYGVGYCCPAETIAIVKGALKEADAAAERN